LGNLKGVGAILAILVLLLSASLARADDQTFVVKKIQLVGCNASPTARSMTTCR